MNSRCYKQRLVLIEFLIDVFYCSHKIGSAKQCMNSKQIYSKDFSYHMTIFIIIWLYIVSRGRLFLLGTHNMLWTQLLKLFEFLWH